MFDFAFRNLMLFFKDKMTVCLSFLAEFIIVVLYVLFIRENMIKNFAGIKGIEALMDSWMIAGILGITSVTTTMGAYGIMVEDGAKKIRRDFSTSPIRKNALLGGYMLSAVCIGLFMTILLFLLSSLYMLQKYQLRLGVGYIIEIFTIFIITTLANSSMVLFLVSFLKTSNALASCCTILGALIGFLTGIYLPMGSMPEQVQGVVKWFPVSHGVVLLRQYLMVPLFEESFQNAPKGAAKEFAEYLGVYYIHRNQYLSQKNSVVLLLATTLIFLLFTIYKMTGNGENE